MDKKAKHRVNLFLCSKQNQDDCQDIRELFKFLGYSVEMFMSSSAGVSISALGSFFHLFPLGTERKVFYASETVRKTLLLKGWKLLRMIQCFGSGSGRIRIIWSDPDPYQEPAPDP